jgi:DMSO reductase family type II enzyme chaperone
MKDDATRSDDLSRARDAALCRSVLYGTMSLALNSPSADGLAKLCSQETAWALLDAAEWLEGSAEIPVVNPTARTTQTAIPLTGRVRDWLQTFPSLSMEALMPLHGRLFGHTARGSVCPYETEYGPEALFQQPRQLAEIRGFYEAFGLTPRDDERERADHTSCELEFLDFLCRKEAYALESKDEAMLEETRKAIRLFLKNHVGRFAPAFGRSLRDQDNDGFFGQLGSLLRDFVVQECRRVRVESGPPLLALRSAEDDKVPMACGESSDSDLVQLETPT